MTFDTLHLVARNLDFRLSLVQLDWLVTLNLETEPCLSPFGSLQGKAKKKKGSFRRTQALGTWHLDTGKLAPWDWVLRLELPFSFPLWNSSLLSPLTCAKLYFCCCQVEWFIQPWYRQPTRPSLSNESSNQNLQTTTPITVASWLYLRWQGQENTSQNALWQRFEIQSEQHWVSTK